jgi:hypothetical protein
LTLLFSSSMQTVTPLLLGDRLDLLQAGDRVLDPVVVRHAVALAEEADRVREAGRLQLGQAGLEGVDQRLVVLGLLRPLVDAAGADVGHRAGQPEVVLGDGPLLLVEQIDGGQAAIDDALEERLERPSAGSTTGRPIA